MAVIGDRIEVVSKGSPRSGVVIAVSSSKLTVHWDTGGETSLIAGPGVLSMVTKKPVAKKAAAKRAVAKKVPASKKKR
jgi:hypothetical protein